MTSTFPLTSSFRRLSIAGISSSPRFSITMLPIRISSAAFRSGESDGHAIDTSTPASFKARASSTMWLSVPANTLESV
jgi:hypothetical protein